MVIQYSSFSEEKLNTNADAYAGTPAAIQNTGQQYSTPYQGIDTGRPPAYDSLSGVNIPFEKSSLELQSHQPNIDGFPVPSLIYQRPAPPSLPYSFPPMYLTANGRHLDQGFPLMPPPSLVQPHPFASHDVNELDWNQ